MERSLAIIGVIALLSILNASVLVQSDGSLMFRAKGTIVGEHFTGGTIWTSIEGDKSTTVAQWKLGRSLIHSDVLPISDCEPAYSICLEATVVDSQNSAAAKPGDQFIVKIDPENKKQIIVGKSGVLENMEIIINITKSYEKA